MFLCFLPGRYRRVRSSRNERKQSKCLFLSCTNIVIFCKIDKNRLMLHNSSTAKCTFTSLYHIDVSFVGPTRCGRFPRTSRYSSKLNWESFFFRKLIIMNEYHEFWENKTMFLHLCMFLLLIWYSTGSSRSRRRTWTSWNSRLQWNQGTKCLLCFWWDLWFFFLYIK